MLHETGTRGESKLILIADDYADVLELTVELIGMEAPHHQLATAARGDDALRLGLELKPDVCLLDIDMPGLTGLEVAAGIRAEGGPAPVLIAMTGGGLAEQAARSGLFDHVLTKPVDFDDLLLLIDHAPSR